VSGRLLLGVDGGNTKTVALIAREDGTIVGAGRAGCSDHYGEITPAGAYDEIASSVRAALAAGGGEAIDIASSCFSLAGADWPEDIAVYKRELAGRLQLPIPAAVVNDAIGALRAGTSDGVGVAVACGTGTAIGARAHDGRVWHVSHWGLPSYRFSLARGAIEAAVQAELGIEPPTLLQELVPASAGHRSVEELRAGLRALREGEADAYFPVPDAMVDSQAALVIDTARAKKLPTMFQEQESVVQGGLASYGASYYQIGRLSAKYVQRMLTGTSPQNLPVESLSRLTLAVNLKTARELGITIPQSVVVRADKVIE
jgi:hypothetical protein